MDETKIQLDKANDEIKPDIAAISWTGGKDCNLALLYAKRDPKLDVRYLVTFCPEGGSFRAHPIKLMEAQAESLGMHLIFITIPKDTTDYMEAYVDGLRRIKEDYGIKVICTGDMDLVGTMDRNWIERCCEKIDGLRVYLPLWRKDRRECLANLLREGFEIIFSCVKSPFFDGSWINRKLDKSALADMEDILKRGLTDKQKKMGVKPLDLCGERGEYHTMCLDGPIYQNRVVVNVESEPLKEELKYATNWKGNIHNAESIWMISLR